MASIESIGSVMSAQVKTNEAASRPSVDYTDVSTRRETPKVDNETLVVEKKEKASLANAQKQAQDQMTATKETIHKTIEDINRRMNNSEVVYGFHEDTNRVTIKIVDKDTKEVIKELPPEKTLDMIAKVWEMAGIMVDERR